MEMVSVIMFLHMKMKNLSKRCFPWKKDQGETIYDGNYLDATNKWLDEINVLAISRPTHTDCVYWYKSHKDHSKIIMCYGIRKKRDSML